jgi:hypothetical protein
VFGFVKLLFNVADICCTNMSLNVSCVFGVQFGVQSDGSKTRVSCCSGTYEFPDTGSSALPDSHKLQLYKLTPCRVAIAISFCS